jgi:hypothetical protein
MADLTPVATNQIITTARQNLIGNYIEDGTHRINTLSLKIQGTEVINSSGEILGTGAQLTAVTGTVGTTDTLTVVTNVTQDPVTKLITLTTKVLTIVNGRITSIV